MKKIITLGLIAGTISLSSIAQVANPPAEQQKKAEAYQFTTVKALPITSIKDQNRTGTCWSFSSLGFFEIEAKRASGIDVDLSPMYVVSHSYKDKARKYIRMHGNLNFAQGGSFYDALYVIKHYGIVPMAEMQGLDYGSSKHNHNELEAVTTGFLSALSKESEKSNTLSTAWGKAFDGIIDSYLGKAPENFTFAGKNYTPKSFAAALKLNTDDYISLTSYTHHPFYKPFVLEIPDNWRMSSSYNVPLDEFAQVFDSAIEKGYAIAWGTDVSEVGFTRDGIGVLVDTQAQSSRGSDQEKWVGKAENKSRSIYDLVNHPNCPEVNVTQEYRQEGFDHYATTDDHGMVIYGIAKDQFGKKFYMVKNSWGNAGKYNGIWYVSEAFVKGKTMNIVVNKNALPAALRKKLGV